MSWVVALTTQIQAGADADDVAHALREASADLGREVTPDHRAAIAAIAACGVRMSGFHAISDAVVDVLFDLAVQNRAAGRHQVAAEALDAVVDVVGARLAAVTPAQQVLTMLDLPSSAVDPQPPAPAQASRSRLTIPAPRFIAPAQPERNRPALERVVELTRQPVNVTDLNELLHDLVPDRAGEQPLSRGVPSSEDQGYELLEATVDRLIAVLTSPTPSSTGWSGGHHEASGFPSDIERLGRLGRRMFTGHRYSRSDAVETHLETVAAKLISTGTTPQTPQDRTGWRTAHLARRPSPASTMAVTLRDLAVEAFEAGYDRRALLTGRRLLALATAAATAGDHVATRAYTEAIYLFINRTTRHSRSAAVAERGALIIAGLIRESDDLRRALPAEEGDPDSAGSLLRALPWQADGFEHVLAAEAWQSELRAVGWLPEARARRSDRTMAGRLPAHLRDKAFEQLKYHLADVEPIYSTALLLTLWAGAVQARADGDTAPASELADYLAGQVAELDNEEEDEWPAAEGPLPDDGQSSHDDVPHSKVIGTQLRCIIDAITVWAKTEDNAPPVIPAANDGGRHLLGLLAQTARTADFHDWTYHGVVDAEGSSLVVIQYTDEERLLLRDEEAGARGLFTWGYSGNGPIRSPTRSPHTLPQDSSAAPTASVPAPSAWA